VVTAVGEGVDVAVGTRIMGVTLFTSGQGGFAEECLIGAGHAFGVPDGLSDAHAAGFWIPHLTAWIGLVDRGRVEPDEWLAVLGAAGGSGIAAVQLGKALGARVVAVVSDDERAAFCRGLGADATIDRNAGSVGARLRAITEGRGVDVVYDPVGGAVAEDAARGMARNGRLLAVGFASGHWPRIPTHELVTTNTSLLGVFAGGYARDALEAIHARLSDLVTRGALRDSVTTEVAFDDVASGVQCVADGHAIGKSVVVL
jgi:NADPH2:quinone reductase